MIHQADVLVYAAGYAGEPFHAILCDPPYHLTSIQERFGKDGAAPAAEGVYRRSSAGFMGKAWDGGDIAFQPETWAALAGLLYPGAFILAFAGTRGYHRMACAMEDAGLLIHPLLIWMQGQGFPKATRVKDERFSGHRYGGQVLKPSLECIACAQKPYSGKPVECITKTGAGALNVDGGRVLADIPTASTKSGGRLSTVYSGGRNTNPDYEPNGKGRWPANLCLDEVGAEYLDRMSGVSGSGSGVRRIAGPGEQPFRTDRGWNSHSMRREGASAPEEYGDTGGASRFFHVSDWTPELNEPAFYAAKAGSRERNAGLGDRPIRPDAHNLSSNACGRCGLRVKANGSGKKCECNDRITIKLPQAANHHPCIKPIRLTRWLASLLLPPAEYAPRRILVPFAGSGSECIGAHLAGWDEVVGVEMDAEYCEIARARYAFWSGNAGLFEQLTRDDEPEPQESLPL